MQLTVCYICLLWFN